MEPKYMKKKENTKGNNYDYSDVNPSEILKKWTYDDDFKDTFDKESIFDDVSSGKSFEEKLYEIVLWKLNRRIIVSDMVEKDIIQLSRSDNKEDIITLIDLLVNRCKGIGLPMASTILHFYSGGKYPILDQRSARVIYKFEPKYNINNPGECYYEYYEHCVDYYRNHNLYKKGLHFKDIDKYLYQLDKKNRNKNS